MRIIIFVSLCLLNLLFSRSVIAGDFSINRFHSEIIINSDSSIDVREVIEVEFYRQRHGIYREIPYKFKDELGRTIKTPLKVISVTDAQGRSWNYRIIKTPNTVKVRIGDPEKYVKGSQTYVISYRVENAILFFDDHDELYWNVTGNYWQAPIKRASAKIILLTGKESQQLWASCYTGAYGSTMGECEFNTAGRGAEFFTKRGLSPGEGLTIAFGWDKGIISQPTSFKKLLWKLDIEENWVFLLPVISLIFMINLWYRKGRDTAKISSIVVRYEPPVHNNTPLTPAEVGTIVDEKADMRDFSATVVGLAVKGYIRIEETKKEGLLFSSTDYYLAKLRPPDENLTEFEKLFMEYLFKGNVSGILVSSLKNKFYTNLEILKKTLYEGLVRKGYFLVNPDKIRQLYFISGIFISIGGFFIFGMLSSFFNLKGVIAGVLTGLPVIGFARFMPAKTKEGVDIYNHVLGFREFLSRAERDRLERMADENLFSRFLPYAIALDVVENWADAFEGIYQAPPDWYVSTHGFRTFRPGAFSNSIASVTSSLGSVIFSAPRGSGVGGSGGGGFSGGGFGGGGGGSW